MSLTPKNERPESSTDQQVKRGRHRKIGALAAARAKVAARAVATVRKPVLFRMAAGTLAAAGLVALPMATGAGADSDVRLSASATKAFVGSTQGVYFSDGTPTGAGFADAFQSKQEAGDAQANAAQTRAQRQLATELLAKRKAEIAKQREAARERAHERKLAQREKKIDKVLDFVADQKGEPYVWAAVGPDRWDCSGITMRAYEQVGIETGRTTWDQKDKFAERKVDWDDLKPGDLVFFSNDEHMGIVNRDGYMLHAPRSGDVVREEKLGAKRHSMFTGAVRPIA